MKKLLVVVFILALQPVFSQVSKSLGEFNAVLVFDKLNVKLIAANENKVVIEGDRQYEVEVVNKNGNLKLRMPFPRVLAGENISVTVYYKKIDEVEASEGSIVSSDDIFTATIFNVSAREGAKINLKVAAEKLNTRVVTGADVTITGTAINHDASLLTGGILDSRDVITSQTSISVSAGGTAQIYATALVDAKVRAGGSIFIFGKPKQINKATVFGGKIEEKI